MVSGISSHVPALVETIIFFKLNVMTNSFIVSLDYRMHC